MVVCYFWGYYKAPSGGSQWTISLNCFIKLTVVFERFLLISWCKTTLPGTFLQSWWECKLVQSLWRFLKNLETELPYDLQSYSWGYNCRKLIRKDTCTPMFIALFTTARTWKPHVRWMVKDVCTHTQTHTRWNLLSHKKEWNNACSNRDGSRDYHTKWSQSQRDKYHVLSLMWNLKKQMNLFTKQIYRYWIKNKMVTKGETWMGRRC